VKVNLHIERLVLDGPLLNRAQGPAVKAAVEAELARLISDRGISNGLMAGGAISGLSGEGISATRRASPTSLGKQIARSVYGSLSR
jgi:hypothetical protein